MKKDRIMILVQTVVIIAAGFFSGDSAFALINSGIGVVFNYLVSVNQPVGFWFGVVYALMNGVIALQGGIYATAFFMFVIQAPMAVYSYISWKKKKGADAQVRMKEFSRRGKLILTAAMIASSIVMYGVLQVVNGQNTWIDTVFFVFSVYACFLLAFYYKAAYILCFLSGAGGCILWFTQMLRTGNGLALSLFYLIVAVNSAIGLKMQYGKQKSVN